MSKKRCLPPRWEPGPGDGARENPVYRLCRIQRGRVDQSHSTISDFPRKAFLQASVVDRFGLERDHATRTLTERRAGEGSQVTSYVKHDIALPDGYLVIHVDLADDLFLQKEL